MLKIKLSKKNNASHKLYNGFEHSSLVVRSNELTVPALSISKDDKQKIAGILDDTSTMLVKLPSSPMTKSVQDLFNSGHANVAFRLDKNTNQDRVSRINSILTYVHGKPTYVSIDANTTGVANLEDSNLLVDSKKAVQTLYHGLIRLAVLTAGEKGSSSLSKLTSHIVDYYKRFFKHSLDLSTLDIRQDMKFEYAITYLLLIIDLKIPGRMAKQHAIDSVNSNFRSTASSDDFDVVLSEIDDYDSLFNSAESFKDIFKIFNSMGIVLDNESTQITKAFNSAGVQNYLALTGPFDFVVASIIMSKYSKIYVKLMLDASVIDSIEVEVVKLIKHIQYGSAANVAQI